VVHLKFEKESSINIKKGIFKEILLIFSPAGGLRQPCWRGVPVGSMRQQLKGACVRAAADSVNDT